MSRSSALLLLLAVLALGAAGLFWLRQHAREPLGAPSVQAGSSRPSEAHSEPVSVDARETVARQSAETAPAQPAAGELAPHTTASITIELVAGGKPASAGEVSLRRHEGKEPAKMPIDPATGEARFEHLDAGEYIVQLSNLPRGWLAPRSYTRIAPSDEAERTITLEGEDQRKRIELEPAVRLFGDVRTPRGQLVKSTHMAWGASSIRVHCWRKSDTWAESVGELYLDVVDGRYESDFYEGLWVLSVQGMPELDGPGNVEHCAPPAPVLRRLLPSTSTEVDFDFRAQGTSLVRGRILDESGQPFVGLRGVIDEINLLEDPTSRESLQPDWSGDGAGGSFTTGPDGRFECANLVPGHYHFSVEPEGFNPRGGAGERTRFGEVPPTRTFDVAGDTTTIELSVRRAHPVHITGRILVDKEWVAAHAQKGAQPTLELVYGYPIAGVPENRDSITYVNLESSFDAWLDAGMLNPRFELALAGEKLVLPLALVPDVELAPLTIRFPR